MRRLIRTNCELWEAPFSGSRQKEDSLRVFVVQVYKVEESTLLETGSFKEPLHKKLVIVLKIMSLEFVE